MLCLSQEQNCLIFREKGIKLHVAFTQSSQSLHMLSNSSVGIPSDIWIPVNGRVKTCCNETNGYRV